MARRFERLSDSGQSSSDKPERSFRSLERTHASANWESIPEYTSRIPNNRFNDWKSMVGDASLDKILVAGKEQVMAIHRGEYGLINIEQLDLSKQPKEELDTEFGKIEVINLDALNTMPLEAEVHNLHLRGELYQVRMIELPTPRYNCHSYTFTKEKTGFLDPQVAEAILDGHFTPTETPQKGDVVIYRSFSTKEIRHSGLVEGVRDGKVSKISSKWGIGGLYEHDPDLKMKSYGDWEIYRRKSPQDF